MNATGLSTVDVDVPDLAQSQIDALENAVNRVIMDNRLVKTYFVAPDAPILNTLRRSVKFDKVSGDVRLVEIVVFDLTACAGTHVPQTGMLGALKILKVENYKGGSRLHFAVGDELLRQFRHYNQTLDAVAMALSVATDQVLERVEKLQSERSDLYKQVQAQTEQLLSYEAQTLLQAVQGQVIIHMFSDRDNNDLRTLANLLTAEDVIVVFANQSGEDTTLIVAAPENSAIHAGNTLRAILAAFEGRGGGRDSYAQGILKNFADTDALQAAIEEHLSV